MPRKPIPKTTHAVVATVESEPWIDEGTGEVKQKLVIHEPDPDPAGPLRGRPRRGSTRTRISRGRKRKVSQAYVMLDTESVGMLDLSRQEYRVYALLLSKVDLSGEIRVTIAYIAKSSGMTANNASVAMKSLRERNIVIAEGYGVWRINANIAWVGDWKKWGKAAADDPQPIWSLEEPPALAVVP